MRRFFSVIILCSLLTLAGCGSSVPDSPPATTNLETQSALPNATEAQPPVSATSTVSLDIKNWDETLELVAQHKGKIVVLDLWSTSCDPCMVEFPHLVELHKKHSGGKLVCMSASCDYAGIKSKPPESYRDHVFEFLTSKEATFPNVLLNVESDVLFEKIDLASIPAVYVFGADGQIAKRFDNDNAKPGEDFTYTKDIVPYVEGLLAE